MKTTMILPLLLSLIIITSASKDKAKELSSDGEEIAETAQKTPPFIELSGPKAYKVKVKKKSVGYSGEQTKTCIPSNDCFCTEQAAAPSPGMYIQAELELQNTVSTNATDVTFTFFYKQNGLWVRQMSDPKTFTLPAVGTEKIEDTGDMLLYDSLVFPDSIKMQVNSPNTIGNTGLDTLILTKCSN
jgi:hypothetical protein